MQFGRFGEQRDGDHEGALGLVAQRGDRAVRLLQGLEFAAEGRIFGPQPLRLGAGRIGAGRIGAGRIAADALLVTGGQCRVSSRGRLRPTRSVRRLGTGSTHRRYRPRPPQGGNREPQPHVRSPPVRLPWCPSGARWWWFSTLSGVSLASSARPRPFPCEPFLAISTPRLKNSRSARRSARGLVQVRVPRRSSPPPPPDGHGLQVPARLHRPAGGGGTAGSGEGARVAAPGDDRDPDQAARGGRYGGSVRASGPT